MSCSSKTTSGLSDQRIGVVQMAKSPASRGVDEPSTAQRRSMGIVGYTDRLSVSPGHKIKFMISCDRQSYRAEIVRLIHGDRNPIGPGFKAKPIRTKVSGNYPGVRK